MADYNATDTGTKIELTPINGRVADGIRLSDVLSIQQIMAAQTLLPFNVAAASAVKMVDISADLTAHLTVVSGQISVISAKRAGNIVSFAMVCTGDGVAEGQNISQFVLSKYRPLGNQAYCYSMSQGTVVACYLRGRNNPDQTSGVRPMYHNYTAGNQVNLEFTYLTDDF